MTEYNKTIEARLDRIELALYRLEQLATSILQETKMAHEEMNAALAALQAEVTREATVQASAITLLEGIVVQLEAAANDPIAVQALAAQLKTQTDALSAAVEANTPAAP